MSSASPELKKTILLVEDEFLIAMMESRDLESAGYNVVHAADGRDAVEIIRSRGGGIDLVLMDIDLGQGMDGTEAARQILEIREIPVIFLSSYTEMEIVNRTEEITSYGYVVKNTGMTVLCASIRMAFRLFDANRKISLKNNEILKASSRLMELNEELLRSRNSIAESEERYKRIYESFLDVYYRIDPSGVITEVSPSVQDISGWRIEEITGTPVHDLYVNPSDREVFLERVAREGRVNGFETVFRKKDGSGLSMSIHARVITDHEGRPAGMEGTLRDISEKRRSEERLFQTIEQYRILIDNSVDMIWTMDAAGRLTYVSPAWERVLGYSLEFSAGKDFRIFIHSEDVSWCSELILKGIRSGERIKSPPYRVLNSDGKYRWHEASGIAVYDNDGVFHSVVGISRDVHERKIDNDRLFAAKKAADSASMAKSDFITKISHEIRTPLNGVIGFTGLLQTTDLDGEQRRYAENASVSAMSLLDLVDEILDFSKIESGMMQIDEVETDIPGLLSRIEEITGLTARSKGVLFRLETDSSMPRYATVDPVRLRQVLLNLAGNAVKFTEKGSVVLKAGFTRVDDVNGVFRFSVTDTGPGISSEQRDRIFSPFIQGDASTTRRYGGTGLGLAITASLLEQMGSSIDLVSEPGRGSCFSFEILRPCGSSSSTAAAGDESLSGTAADTRSFRVGKGDYRIIIAEDNEINLELAKAFAKRTVPSAVIIEARDGAEALKAWQDNGADIVFMDIQMPVMDGYAVTSEIRRMEKNRPRRTTIIALTAGAVRGEREMCLECGMDDYIVKPADFRRLSSLIEKYLMPESAGTDSLDGTDFSSGRFNVDELRRRLGGDEELLTNLIGITCRHFGGYISGLLESVEENNHLKVSRQLHLLKGAALNACFNRLAGIVCDFEKQMPCDLGKMRRLASGIAGEYRLIVDEIAGSGLISGEPQS